jgi:hypothetical protein
MTRKHFVAVAATVAAIEDTAKRAEQARHCATIFAGTNPRFDRARFLAACKAA